MRLWSSLAVRGIWTRRCTQAAWEAARKTAAGSLKGEMNGSERINRYSSGMYVRLAFAVAAHLEPEPERWAAWRKAAAGRPAGLREQGGEQTKF
jgi:hypothetical protein